MPPQRELCVVQKDSGAGLWPFFVAEFLKIACFRMSRVAYLAIPIATYLFVFQIFHVEHLSEHWKHTDAISVLPLLFFASWKTLLLQLLVVAFSAYCISVECQYGMIRVICTQPISRRQYVFGKLCAISAHVLLIALDYVLSLVLWAVIYLGARNIHSTDMPILARFSATTVIFLLSLSCIVVGISLLRRTTISALWTSCAVLLGLAMMTTFPKDWNIDGLLFWRYFFFPIQHMNFPWQTVPPQFSFVSFLLTMACTGLVFLVPGLLRFQSRDITE